MQNGSDVKNYRSKLITDIRPWLVVFAAASFVFLINSATNLNVITPYLSAKFHFTDSEIGFLFACYYYSNILFVFWAGIILDRVSAKKILIISLIVANCSILIFAITKSFVLMALTRLMLGIVGSFSMLNCFQLIKRWFPADKTALITGLATTYAALGGLFAQTPLMLAIEKLGWRAGLLLNFWLGILFCIFALLFAQDFPLAFKKSSSNQHLSNNQLALRKSIKKIIINRQNWLIGFYISLITLSGLFFGASWGISYLQQVKGLLKIESTYVINFNIVGSMLGATLIGWLSDKFHTRKLPLTIGSIFIVLILLIITYATKISLLTFTLLFFVFGLMSSLQIICYPLIAENNPAHLVGAATGFLAALTALSGIYMPFLGWLIDYCKANQSYTSCHANNYYLAMPALIIAVILSIFLALFVKETHGQNKNEFLHCDP